MADAIDRWVTKIAEGQDPTELPDPLSEPVEVVEVAEPAEVAVPKQKGRIGERRAIGTAKLTGIRTWFGGTKLPGEGYAITTYPARVCSRRYKRGSVLRIGIDTFEEAMEIAKRSVEALGVTLYVIDPVESRDGEVSRYGYQHSVYLSQWGFGPNKDEVVVSFLGVSWM